MLRSILTALIGLTLQSQATAQSGRLNGNVLFTIDSEILKRDNVSEVKLQFKNADTVIYMNCIYNVGRLAIDDSVLNSIAANPSLILDRIILRAYSTSMNTVKTYEVIGLSYEQLFADYNIINIKDISSSSRRSFKGYYKYHVTVDSEWEQYQYSWPLPK